MDGLFLEYTKIVYILGSEQRFLSPQQFSLSHKHVGSTLDIKELWILLDFGMYVWSKLESHNTIEIREYVGFIACECSLYLGSLAHII